MSRQVEKAERFLELHRPGTPLLMPNAWDPGSAKIIASLGFAALATTSSGHAATLGRLDGGVTREEAIAHAKSLVQATDVPVSADLENGFEREPDGVARTVELALEAGLAGCSIEDSSGDEASPIYDLELARRRVAAAAEVAHRGPVHLVLTARAENHLHGRADIEDTIARLLAYAEAGADVLFAPGLSGADDVRRIVEAVQRPLNVLANPRMPPVSELARLGVSRISVGGAFAFAAYAALVDMAQELRDEGTYGYAERTAAGVRVAHQVFG